MSILCHTVHQAKKEVEVVCNKERANRKGSNRGRERNREREKLVILGEWIHITQQPPFRHEKYKPAMTVTSNGEKSLWAYSQPLLHYQLQIINVLQTVWFSMAYSIMLCRHHSNWGPHGKASVALRFLGALSLLLWNAVAGLLLVAVIALAFDGLLLW